jgi:hypothetical protein
MKRFETYTIDEVGQIWVGYLHDGEMGVEIGYCGGKVELKISIKKAEQLANRLMERLKEHRKELAKEYANESKD